MKSLFYFCFFICFGCQHIFVKRSDSYFVLPAVLHETKRITEDGVEAREYASASGALAISKVWLKRFSDKEGQEMLAARRAFIFSMYQDHIEPYWGKVDTHADCVAELDISPPISEDPDGKFLYYDLNATKNFVIGTCNPTIETYRLKMYYYYCKTSGTLVELKLLEPQKKETLKIVPKCP